MAAQLIILFPMAEVLLRANGLGIFPLPYSPQVTLIESYINFPPCRLSLAIEVDMTSLKHIANIQGKKLDRQDTELVALRKKVTMPKVQESRMATLEKMINDL